LYCEKQLRLRAADGHGPGPGVSYLAAKNAVPVSGEQDKRSVASGSLEGKGTDLDVGSEVKRARVL